MSGDWMASRSSAVHTDSGKRAAMNPVRSHHALVAICGARLSGDSAELWHPADAPKDWSDNRCTCCQAIGNVALEGPA